MKKITAITSLHQLPERDRAEALEVVQTFLKDGTVSHYFKSLARQQCAKAIHRAWGRSA